MLTWEHQRMEITVNAEDLRLALRGFAEEGPAAEETEAFYRLWNQVLDFFEAQESVLADS